jgi:hypothetical protein
MDAALPLSLFLGLGAFWHHTTARSVFFPGLRQKAFQMP